MTPRRIPAAIRARIRIERRITRRLAHDILAAGYLIQVEEILDRPTRDLRLVMRSVGHMDEDRLYVHRAGQDQPFGWVFLVYGNDGWDVISDYTVNLEDGMANAMQLALELGEIDA